MHHLQIGILEISGKRGDTTEQEDPNRRFYKRERRFGSFVKRITIPINTDTEKIGVTFKNGELTVVLPKYPAGHSSVKKITIS